MRHLYTPDALLPVYHKLFTDLIDELKEPLASLLKCRRIVSRHGTCNSVLQWSIWDRRQNEATLPPGFFSYWVNYDPDHFETDRTDWMLKLHMNTVRIYQNQLDVRAYLLKRMPGVCPRGFQWAVHPRELRVEHPFDFSGLPAHLPGFLLSPLTRLIRATHPVLERLIEAFGQPLTREERAKFIANRATLRIRAARGADVPNRAAYRHGIPRSLRDEVLARYGRMCAICGCPLRPGDEVHIDHIVQFAQGGLTEPDNLQPSHAACNLRKGSGRLLDPSLRIPVKARPGWRKHGGRKGD